MLDRLLTTSRTALLHDGEDGDFREFLHDYFAFAQNLEDARIKFASHIGLSATQYMILIAIAHGSPEKALGINQVAERLHLSGAFVTIEVSKLVAEGLVDKKPHPTDGRRVQLFATRIGIDRLVRLAAFQRPVNDALFDGLSTDEFKQLAGILARLADNGRAAIKLADHLESKAKGQCLFVLYEHELGAEFTESDAGDPGGQKAHRTAVRPRRSRLHKG